MEQYVTAKQAADMTGQSERTIRRWIEQGKLPARKEAVNRYRIRVSDLPPRKRSPLADLRAEVEDLKRRIEVLERANASVSRSAANLTVWDAPYVPTTTKPPDVHYTATSSASSFANFANRADAARWLTLHGVHSEYTPKTWSGWRELVPLTQEAVLAFALSKYDPANWRITWRLHRCGDPACACASIL